MGIPTEKSCLLNFDLTAAESALCQRLVKIEAPNPEAER